MSQAEFEQEMRRLLRRYQLLTAVRSGDVKLKRIVVHRKKMTWTVRAKRRTYERYVAPAGWDRRKKR